MSLGERLKELRVRNRKSLQQLAEEIGASKAHIWELETGRAKNPSIELLSLLAKALKASVADLIGENPHGSGEPADVVRMYRELKELTPEDRRVIQTMMDHFLKRKE
jgi:transcriptional regulator with XRE-family HTH domain